MVGKVFAPLGRGGDKAVVFLGRKHDHRRAPPPSHRLEEAIRDGEKLLRRPAEDALRMMSVGLCLSDQRWTV